MDKEQQKEQKPQKMRDLQTIDLSGQVFGRAASAIALALRGKRKVDYEPNIDNGDRVVAYNAAKLKFRGNKELGKKYYRYSGYPGGLRTVTLKERQEKGKADLLRDAVFGMLPKNRLRKAMIGRLEIHEGELEKKQAEKKR